MSSEVTPLVSRLFMVKFGPQLKTAQAGAGNTDKGLTTTTVKES